MPTITRTDAEALAGGAAGTNMTIVTPAAGAIMAVIFANESDPFLAIDDNGGSATAWTIHDTEESTYTIATKVAAGDETTLTLTATGSFVIGNLFYAEVASADSGNIQFVTVTAHGFVGSLNIPVTTTGANGLFVATHFGGSASALSSDAAWNPANPTGGATSGASIAMHDTFVSSGANAITGTLSGFSTTTGLVFYAAAGGGSVAPKASSYFRRLRA